MYFGVQLGHPSLSDTSAVEPCKCTDEITFKQSVFNLLIIQNALGVRLLQQLLLLHLNISFYFCFLLLRYFVKYLRRLDNFYRRNVLFITGEKLCCKPDFFLGSLFLYLLIFYSFFICCLKVFLMLLLREYKSYICEQA